MRNKILIIFISILVFTILISFWNINTGAVTNLKNNSDLTLEVNSKEQNYTLGEIVELKFTLKNEGEKPEAFVTRPDVWTGFLQVWISSDGKDYKIYKNSSWGLKETGGLILQPGKSFESQAVLLWNEKPDTININPSAYKDKITTDYAFPKAGTYFIKAVLSFSDTDKPKLKSEPVQIVFKEPVGEDLEVWNKIKDSGNFALFIQEGHPFIPIYKTEECAKFIEEVEQILTQYPNSFYAESLRQSLDKFKAFEAKRQEFLQKIQRKN